MEAEELNNGNIDLGTELTINKAEEIKEILLNEFSRNQFVNINNSSASQIDVTYLQLLIAGKNFAANNNKLLNIENTNEHFLKLMTETGINPKYFNV